MKPQRRNAQTTWRLPAAAIEERIPALIKDMRSLLQNEGEDHE